MKIALIALPDTKVPVIPPLTLAYVAAALEQQRHIVRIYDLALSTDNSLIDSFRPLRTFRPHIVIVVGDQLALMKDAEAFLYTHHDNILLMHLGRDDLAAGRAYAQILAHIDQQLTSEHDRIVINNKDNVSSFHTNNIDELPLPARHLLSLERYGLRAPGNELQTTVLVGTIDTASDANIILRSPAQIVAELHSVSREYGIRHYLLPEIELTTNTEWLQELLTRLRDADLHIGWEGIANVEQLDEALLAQMARSGCETLNFDFNTTRVFDSATARARLKQTITQARQLGIYARADLDLDPPYASIPHLVDVAATFGLDGVTFNVHSAKIPDKEVTTGSEGGAQRIEEFARQRYHAGRDRQRMIDRFGAALGTLLWKLRNSRLGLALESERFTGGLEEPEAESV